MVLVALLVMLAPSTGLAAPARQDNLLVNPGFEQPYEDGKQANGWGRWFEDTGKKDGTLDYAVNPTFSAEVNPALVRNGSTSQHVGNQYDPWHAGVLQSVKVTPGARLRFCAHGRLFANNEDFEKAPSIPSLNGNMQVGIFPDGTVTWDNGGIVWSAAINPHDTWQQVCVDATAGPSGQVTVFTSSNYRGSSAFHLEAWWDDASLTAITSAPATTPAQLGTPAPPAQAPTASASGCQPQADGTVTYVVKSGDTLYAIAIACDTTVAAIQQLNALSGTTILVGQTLIIKGTGAPPPAAPTAALTTATPSLSPTLVATATTETPTATATPQAVAAVTEGQICVEAFNDANANQTKDEGEQLLGGVSFMLSDSAGPRGTYVTSGLEAEPYCFAGLPAGSYNVDAGPPSGVTSTTAEEWPVGLTGGMGFNIAYGGSREAAGDESTAPPDTTSPDTSTTPEESGTQSDLGRVAMGALGIGVLLAAGFLAGMVLNRARR
jgi:LysM repeat protein